MNTQARHRTPAPLFNTSMSEGLASLRRQSLSSMKPIDRAPRSNYRFNSPFPRPEQDGIDHINFSSTPKTDFGELLSFKNQLHFDHPGLGIKIPSIHHFWVFLNSGGTNTRLFGFDSKQLQLENSRFSGPQQVYTRNMYALLAQAYWYKFQAHEQLANILSEYRGEFDYYLSNRQVPRRPMAARNLVEIMNHLRDCLRNGSEPDFYQFMDQDYQMDMSSLSVAERRAACQEILDQALEKPRNSHARFLERQEALRKQQSQNKKPNTPKEQPKQKKNQPNPKAEKPALIVDASVKPVDATGDNENEAINVRPFEPDLSQEPTQEVQEAVVQTEPVDTAQETVLADTKEAVDVIVMEGFESNQDPEAKL